MSAREINEIADTPRGLTFDPTKSTEQPRVAGEEFRNVAHEAVNAGPEPSRTIEELENEMKGISQSIATLTKEGKVIIEKVAEKK
jgi:hypothetical protein